MATFDAQNTDAENRKPLAKSVAVDDAVKTISSKSARAIARERTNQNTATGSGGENPGAK